MDDNAHLLQNGKHRCRSSDECHQQEFEVQRGAMTRHPSSSAGTKIPSLGSPLVTHYCLTLTTAVLALTGFVGALFAALSCEFMHVHLTDVPSTSAAAAAGWIDSMSETNSTDWYYNELIERQADHSLSVGIFCPNSIIAPDVNDGRVKLSKAFLTTALVLGAILLNITCLISTILSNTERIWNVISITSGLVFLCELPVFFAMDSPVCTGDFTCSLGRGSFGLFCSMACYLIMALLTQWREAPDWREEYELWRLMKRNQEQRTDRFIEQRDVEMGLPIAQKGDAIKGDNMHETKSGIEPVTNLSEEVLPSPPPLPKNNEAISPAATREKERRLFRQTRKEETSNFVGTYINVGNESTTPDRAITEDRNISPVTLFTLSKDGSSAVETGAETEVHKNTEVSHEVLNNSMELINQQLQKSLELKRHLRERQKQREEQQQQIEDISQISFLDYNDADANTKPFQQSPFGKDGFDHVFYADLPDLSSIVVSNDDEDVSRSNPPQENSKAVEKLPSVKGVTKVPIKPPARCADDSSLATSVRSNSTRSTLERSAKHVNQSMKSIFRRKSGKENNKNSANSTSGKETIQEQWMLEETSLGRSNSDDLLFLVERNRGDGASMTSRRSKVTVLSWASRCRSPEKLRSSKSDSVAVVSPTPLQIYRVVSPCNQHMPTEITAESNARGNGSAVVSPEKDDPGVEMYPSDASMSTLSLPTASDYYTSDDDYKQSKLSRKDGSSCSRGFFSGTDSESEEMSIIIAGVQRMNRKTCGKPSHLSKRRRRRKRKSSSRSGCSISEYSSHSGSLLDEVIDEEGPLNESGEPIPAVIDASPIRQPQKKSKSPRKKSISPKKRAMQKVTAPISNALSGYESGYAYRSDFSDDESKRTGYHLLSENEESTSSRAARARRNRLLSKRQIHIDPDSLPDQTNLFRNAAVDASGYKSPADSLSSGRSCHDDSKSYQSQRRDPSYSYNDADVHQIGKHANMGVCFGRTSQRGNISWQARNSRMSRLRMQRQAAESVMRESERVTACGSDEGSI